MRLYRFSLSLVDTGKGLSQYCLYKATVAVIAILMPQLVVAYVKGLVLCLAL